MPNIRFAAEFQSTLPRGERLIYVIVSPSFVNFNPRSREGSDAPALLFLPPYRISIHAPARGATQQPPNHTKAQRNFNPRSREGSDKYPGEAPPVPVRFQSTLPRGERPKSDVRHKPQDYFNPRSREGSDDIRVAGFRATNDFNPRSREGSDVYGIGLLFGMYRFQSTLPRGERPQVISRRVRS